MPNSSLIRDYAQKTIVKKLEFVSGPKDLVIDTELMTPMDRILGASMIKSTGVDKIFKLENIEVAIRGNVKRVYIVKCRPNSMKLIAKQINLDKCEGIICQYHIMMVPRRLYTCEKILEEEGVFGYIVVDELPINLIAIENDILSLEANDFFPNYYLFIITHIFKNRAICKNRDQTCLFDVSLSLVDIQKIYGQIANVLLLGECAQKVDHLYKILLKKESSADSMQETTTTKPSLSSSLSMPSSLSSSSFLNTDRSQSFTHLLLVDRVCDCITPLCSQVTYEGLLDDTFSVKCGYVQLGPEITNQEKMTKVLLSNEDKIYSEIRDRHFSNVSSFLSAKAKELQQGYDKRMDLDISGMKNFVQKDLKNLKSQHNSLSIHVGVSERISQMKTKGEIDLLLKVEHSLLEGVDIKESIQYIEELISRQVDGYKCLSLLSMLSLTEGGLSSSSYKSLTMQYIQSFGFGLMPGIYNLKKLGLLTESGNQFTTTFNKIISAKSYRSLSRKLSLIPKSAEMINLKNPCDMSYVFSGAYTPMLCKIIDVILQYDGFAGLEELLKLLGVPTQSNVAVKSAKSSPSVTSAQLTNVSDGPMKVVLVYFLGGCTYSEIAALRLLAKIRGHEIVVATTSIINSRSFLSPLLEI